MMPHLLTEASDVLTRLAESLRVEVLPRVEESYAVAQVESVALGLDHLAARVAWSPGLIEGELATARAVRAALGGALDTTLAEQPATQRDALVLLAEARAEVAHLVSRGDCTTRALQAGLDVVAESQGGDRLSGGDLPSRSV